MDLIWFCNYVFLPWLLYVILCWSLSVLSCWDSFWLLCIKQLSSKDTRVSNILSMLVVWWATSTTNLIVKYLSHVHKCPIHLNLSRLSLTGQQVTAVLGHQILLWETAFYYDMADDWSKNYISFPINFPLNMKFSLRLSQIEYFSWEHMPLKW